jgi:hypothetical protein
MSQRLFEHQKNGLFSRLLGTYQPEEERGTSCQLGFCAAGIENPIAVFLSSFPFPSFLFCLSF